MVSTVVFLLMLRLLGWRSSPCDDSPHERWPGQYPPALLVQPSSIFSKTLSGAGPWPKVTTDAAQRRGHPDEWPLDGFKVVNDLLGHQAGDDLLCDVACRMRQAVRPADFVARLSGDEFAVVCANIASTDEVQTVAERVRTALSTTRSLGVRTAVVTASVGIAMSDPSASSPDELVRAADVAMYRAKRDGRGRHTVLRAQH